MIDNQLVIGFTLQFENLKKVVTESSKRVISEPPDTLFVENQNVFIKSYLVSACSVLEAFIQDLATSCTLTLQHKINSLKIPYNFLTWITDHDKAKAKFETFESTKTSKDISDLISPNYYKTISTFQRIGIDINNGTIASYKDYICAIVDKRNKIVHHNDVASDLSFADIITTIDTFILYIDALFKAVNFDPHLQA